MEWGSGDHGNKVVTDTHSIILQSLMVRDEDEDDDEMMIFR